MGGRTRPPYPPEFRAEAVRLVRDGGTLSGVARDLGVSIESLRSWSRHADRRLPYGGPRGHAELRLGQGIRCGQERVARLMRACGLQGVHRRKGFRTTRRDATAASAPDLLERDFGAPEPDRKWVADITYVPTWSGFLFLAVAIDCFSRRVVGWAMRDHLRTDLVLEALEMALHTRRPAAGLIHHSDRGCQYTSFAFGRRCRQAGGGPAMGSVGDAFD